MKQGHSCSKNVAIYARVSHVKQVAEGHGLESQITRCHEFAEQQGYSVAAVFTDEITGRAEKRPGMKAMMSFLKKKANNTHVVIIDDISRLARNVQTHWRIRDQIAAVGAIIESPNFEFGESSGPVLIENMMAAVSQHHSQRNGETCFDRMRARLLGGYWVFREPIGYKYEKTPGHGQLLVKDEPVASVLKEGLEGYSSGRFASQAELARFFESKPVFMAAISADFVRIQKVKDLLTRPIYAGYISYMKSREGRVWNVSFREGKHEPIIDLETFEKNQARLSAKPKAALRRDTSEDFPLRGSVLCDSCGRPLTGCWSKGRKKSYPYYLCQKRGCENKGKSIPKQVMENQFVELLEKLEPSEELLTATEAMFRDIWEAKRKSVKADQSAYQRQIKQVDKKIDGFIEMISNATNPTAAGLYEKKIEELLCTKEVLAQKSANLGESQPAFEDVFEPSIRFLGNPCKIWKNSDFTWKRAVLRLAFSEPLQYCKKEGYRTPKTALPFKVLEDFSIGKSEMVPPHGVPWGFQANSTQFTLYA